MRGFLIRLLVFLASLAVAWLAIDYLTNDFAYMRHFHQSWASHVAPQKSFEYGSARDYAFDWLVLLKNWDAFAPAGFGVWLLARQFRNNPAVGIPLLWLALSLGYFSMHKPWWAYYYIHIAIPLCWCATVGIVSACTTLKQALGRQRENIGVTPGSVAQTSCLRVPAASLPPAGKQRTSIAQPTHSPAHPPTRALSLLKVRSAGRALPLLLFALGAAVWMATRVYLQIAGIRSSPQIHSSLVLKEIARYRPYTEWLYADNLTYSFHSGIPMPPPLAVVSLKRLWSGEMTAAGIAAELRQYQPGLIALLNDTRARPFQALLDSEYRLVYHDDENRLYAHRRIAGKPD